MAELNESLIFAIEKQSKLLGHFGVDCVIVGGVAVALLGSAIPTSGKSFANFVSLRLNGIASV